MTTWQDRLKANVVMTSPDGNVFEPLWSGNPRTMEKKIGLFNYPKLDGSITQDLGISGTTYPLTLMFDGPDNDIEAARFFKACRESGLWIIVHPVRGTLKLQLLSVTEHIQPVSSGNITTFETEWIEPINPAGKRSLSRPQLASQIDTQVDRMNVTGSEQFVGNVVQDGAAETTAVESAATGVIDVVTTVLSDLYESVPELNAQILAVIDSIQTTITETTIDTISLAGQIQNLLQLPTLANDDIAGRLAVYSNAIDAILASAPVGITSEDKNTAAVDELALTAAIAALSQISKSGELQTRSQSIDAIGLIAQKFTDITDGLDTVQSAFVTEDIDQQYFSQSASFADASINVTSAIAYLLVASFDLAIEKRFVLEQQRTPIEITITEYGTLGPDDSNYTKFLDSNQLVGNEIWILPAGKEVVVYV